MTVSLPGVFRHGWRAPDVGWGPGQIESEIQANGWVHCDADAALIFGGHMETKWSEALAKLGIDISALSAHAGRA